MATTAVSGGHDVTPAVSARGRRRPWATIGVTAYGTALAWTMVWIATIGIDPWPVYGVAAAAGVVGLIRARHRVGSVLLGLTAVFWTTWIIAIPHGPVWSWEDGAGPAALASAQAAGLATLALVGMGLRDPRAFSWMWLGVVLTTLPIGVREAFTGEHLYPWTGAPSAPVSVFTNTNNYAAVLVVMVTLASGWALSTRSGLGRVCLIALAACCAWLVWMTQSRAALVALLAGLALTAVTAWRLVLVRDNPSRMSRFAARVRPLPLGALGVGLVLVALLALLGQAFASLLFPGDDSTVRSDDLRRDLVRFALARWREHPWFGSGAGSFEGLWAPTGGPVVPPHNGFVELLAENGLLVAGWLFAVLALLTVSAAWPVRGGAEASRPAREHAMRVITMQHLLAANLLGFVLAGVVVSSPLPWFPWWLMLSGAVAAGAWLEVERRGAGRVRTAHTGHAPR